MTFPSVFSILLIFSLVGSSLSEAAASPGGYGSLRLGGAVVTVLAGVAALTSLVLALVLLCRRRLMEAERRGGVAPLLLLLATNSVLCAVSFSHVIERDESVCNTRLILLGVLFVLSTAYLLTQGVRLLGCPSCRPLAGLAIGLAIIHGYFILVWTLDFVLHPGMSACQYQPQYSALAYVYGLTLLTAVPLTLAWGSAERQLLQRCRALWLFVTSFTSVTLWAIWLYRYQSLMLKGSQCFSWEDQLQAEVMVAQAWVLLLFHAAPEAFACLRPAPQPLHLDDFAPLWLRKTRLERAFPCSPSRWDGRAEAQQRSECSSLKPGGLGTDSKTE